MTSYVRPAIHPVVVRDTDGQVIDYGNRWGSAPPADTYSVDTHPERFQPLHTVADALLAHVQDNFLVDTLAESGTVRDLLREPADVIRAVRVTPRLSSAAPLTFVYTSRPSVVIHAGELSDAPFPLCGCDACDDSWEMMADLMEDFVLAVVDGRFFERIGPGSNPWEESGMRTPDGVNEGSRQEHTQSPRKRVRRAQETLGNLPQGWTPWPRKDTGHP
ncbi:MAG: DUF6226 family protein [Arachnia sp.]